MDKTAFISVGSNLGDRVQNCRQAIEKLGSSPQISKIEVSSLYETEPMEVTDQPDFINMAAKLKTNLSARQLLDRCLEIEKEFGRVRDKRYGPRIIDLDLLLYDQAILNDNDLIIPHPRMHQRRFVLAPLAEIAPDVLHPVLKKSNQELLDSLANDAGLVKKLPY
jgi:2-amino-4-hydroxy-6-hydroxymethyldihydropteridine diphosphokinase